MDAIDSAESILTSHPDRAAITAEIHNRPAPKPQSPIRVSHIAMLSGRGRADLERNLVSEICDKYGALPPGPDALFHAVPLGEIELRWERHTEFSTFTFWRKGPIKKAFSDTALSLVPRGWLERLPGGLVAACHVAVYGKETEELDPDQLSEAFEGQTLVGGKVMNGQAVLWSSLRLHDDGFGRYLIHDRHLTSARLGRLLQRVLDIETYRLMALLGLSVARRMNVVLDDRERRLVALAKSTAVAAKGREERDLLEELTALAAEHEQSVADSAYRFGATRAYAELVGDRLARLHLEKLGDLQPLSEFLARRFEPAMRTCKAMEGRMEGLSERINRAANLLRTRVDLELEDQNQRLLASMDKRSQVQLRLQQTVEGLSVAAISYYVLGLLSYATKGLAPLIGEKTATIVLALSVPLVLWGVWSAVRRVRRGLESEH